MVYHFTRCKSIHVAMRCQSRFSQVEGYSGRVTSTKLIVIQSAHAQLSMLKLCRFFPRSSTADFLDY